MLFFSRCAALALAVLLGCGTDPSADPEVATAPAHHVVMIMLDTLRADHLASYGYERQTSPTLDALAQESIFFERMTAAASSTGPSQMTILSGTLPRAHGIFNGHPAQPSARIPSLPRLLNDAGWRTAAFADGGIVSEAYGFDVGFEHFDSIYEGFGKKLDRVESWLQEAPDEPTFLFVHTYGIHAPYLPEPGHDIFTDPEYDGPIATVIRALAKGRENGHVRELSPTIQKFWKLVNRSELTPADTAYIKGLYDGAIHGVDAGVARLLDMLEAKGWMDDTLLVVTSDHGEAFGEHGTFTHRQVYEEELWVPLMIRLPGGGDARRVSLRTSHLDTAPTLLEMLGLEIPADMQGRSMLPFEALDGSRTVFATDSDASADAVILDDAKLVERKGGRMEFYALSEDPDELFDRHGTRAVAARVAQLRKLLSGMRKTAGSLQNRLGAPIVGLDDMNAAQLAELRALGYIK